MDRTHLTTLEDENQVTSLVSQNLSGYETKSPSPLKPLQLSQQVQSQEDNGEVEDFIRHTTCLPDSKEKSVDICLDECHHLRNE